MTDNLDLIASRIRARVVELSHRTHTPHLGSQLSCIDLLVMIYWRLLRLERNGLDSIDRDQFILSKGHAAPALYTTLAFRGLLDFEILDTMASPGSPLAEQPAPNCIPGVEWATGSLGHGLGVAVGKAIAARIAGRDSRFVVLLSDGECNEGSVWEAAMFAAAQNLENLLVLVDFNKWQATGRSRETMALDPLVEKWKAFGWETAEVDGHDLDTIESAVSRFPNRSGRPLAIVAHTVKGKGVDFMEDDNNWHYRIPTGEEVLLAKQQLGIEQASAPES